MLEGFQSQHPAAAIPAKHQLVPAGQPFSCLIYAKRGEGSELTPPLSPFEVPTVCQGAQGAQRALVKAFQESGSREGGGEAEGGFALRYAARPRDRRWAGRGRTCNAHK